jgi:hypothetical protein
MVFRIFIASLSIVLPGCVAAQPLPERLTDTGLFEAGSVDRVRAGNVAFTPAHPLWTDGQSKRRWIRLPDHGAIDKSSPDAWQFPVGTKAWKEFSGPAGRLETRMIERLANGSWRFASYVWNADRTEATLAPTQGIPARGIPSRADCLACHEGAPVPILGYSAVQLERHVEDPVLGYLHGNCGHCHNAKALPSAGLFFAQSAVDPQGSAERARSSLASRGDEVKARMQSHNPYYRMPPIGVQVPDAEAIAAIDRWTRIPQRQPQETKP